MFSGGRAEDGCTKHKTLFNKVSSLCLLQNAFAVENYKVQAVYGRFFRADTDIFKLNLPKFTADFQCH